MVKIISIVVIVASLGLMMACSVDHSVSKSLSYKQLEEYAFETLTLTNGNKINYRIQGNEDGQTILLIHGGGDSLGTWDDWIIYLENDYRIVRFDLPGHGLSDPASIGNNNTDCFADVVAQLVAQLKLDNFTLIGHSFGGDTAARYVLKNPGKAVSLVLIASGGFIQEVELEQAPELLKYWNSKQGKDYLSTPPANINEVRNGLRDYYYNTKTITQATFQRMYDLGLYEKNRGQVMQFIVNYLSDYADLKNLSAIRIPTLLLWGKYDKIVPVKMANRFTSEMSHAKLIVYDKVGHMPPQEVPEQSVQDVVRFIKSNVK